MKLDHEIGVTLNPCSSLYWKIELMSSVSGKNNEHMNYLSDNTVTKTTTMLVILSVRTTCTVNNNHLKFLSILRRRFLVSGVKQLNMPLKIHMQMVFLSGKIHDIIKQNNKIYDNTECILDHDV